MVRIEDSAVIHCPVGAVWSFLSDPVNTPKWYQGDVEVRRTPGGPMSAGTTFEAVVQLRGRPLVLGVRIVKLDRNNEVAWEFTSGPTRGSRDHWKMETIDETSTRLTRAFDMRARGMWKLIQPIMTRGARRAHRAEMANIQRILESPGQTQT